MEDETETQNLLPSKTSKPFTRCTSHFQDELQTFRSCLKWMCVDQSTLLTACLSWSMFILFTILVPCLSHFVLSCYDCDARYLRPYDGVVQVSLSSIASLSFVCLSRFVMKYGLRRFLFFDKLRNESETVRNGYTNQLDRSLKLLLVFVLPCFGVECAYKIWWYASGASRIPFLGNVYLSDAVACILELCSWLYRTSIFFLVCVLFRLICHLQILRLRDFAQVFQFESHVIHDVESILSEHLRIRRHLRIISHRYRVYILWTMIFVTGSQFSSLLITTKYHSNVNLFIAGELAVCSITLVTGLSILLRSATKITHKAHAITCLAAKWHVCATIGSHETVEGELMTPPVARVVANGRNFPWHGGEAGDSCGEDDEAGDEEDDVDSTKIIPYFALNTISYQKRHALVTYFENNKAGITVYGFMLDRTYIHTIFGIELSLVLWLLGKTVGIS